MFNFCVQEENTQQIWQLEQGNSIAWHNARRVFPLVFWEGTKQMCSNIYKCTIFACSSAACPADFARLRLQSGGFCGSPMYRFSQLKEMLSQGLLCLQSVHSFKEQRGWEVTKGQSSFKYSASRIHFAPQRGDTQAITTGEAGAVLKSPPTTWSSGHYSQWAFPQPNTSCFRTATPLAVRQPSRTTEHTPARPSMNALLPEFQLVGPDIYEQKVSQLLLLWLLLAWALCLFAITLR